MQQETLMLATRPAAPATAVIGYTIVDSPLGRLLVAATVRGICAVRLGDSDARLEAELRREYPEAQLQRDGAPLAPWVNALLRHLAGEPLHLAMPLDVQASAFQRRVWSELRAIPYGATRSYGEIARALGRPRAVRAVARACAANPVALAIPCHRVIRGDGVAGGYRWGLRRKRLLLEREHAALEAAERRVMRAFLEDVGSPPRDPVPGAGLASGALIAGRYELLRALGAGATGVVYAARDRELDEVIALKALHRSRGQVDPAGRERFRRELRLTRRISHAHVVRTHDIGDVAGWPFITMEYVDGWSLAQLLERRAPVPLAVALVLGKQLCRALAVVHAQGVIHRDIKPQNVLVTRDGDVKLTDFGIAELESASSEARGDRGPCGTLPYMAPEQLLGDPLDARTDLYATAAVLDECLTGRPPYRGVTPAALVTRARRDRAPSRPARRPDVASPLAELLRAALAIDPTARPASATAFHDALAVVAAVAAEG
jgi:O-6-methylguanine DNA methyltransferase